MSPYPRRLIEVDLPIKKISAHARREKSIRHGHISTLHIWWARRPLAACRAVLCAALWPDPADPLCPQRFRDDACRLVNEFAAKAASDKALAQHCSHDVWKKWQALTKTGSGLDPGKEAHWNVLRFALLDFIADFANWDNSTVAEYLQTARALTQSAHESLGGVPGTRPLVVDPFAGGGSIPLEAIRVGADAFASDLNPIPVLLNKVLIEYIPKYGQRLAIEVRTAGTWIRDQVQAELREFYPPDPDGSIPVAYLWARMIVCEGPGCGLRIPLLSTRIIAKRSSQAHIVLEINRELKTVHPVVRTGLGHPPATDGTVKGGAATCPMCGFTTAGPRVREQLAAKRGGAADALLLAVVLDQPTTRGRTYRSPIETDLGALEAARSRLLSILAVSPDLLPNELLPEARPSPNARGLSPVSRIGVRTFGDLFAPRPALSLISFGQRVQEVIQRLSGADPDFAKAVGACLAFAVDKQADFNSSFARWANHMEKSVATFGRNALPILWDWAEVVPIGDATGSFSIANEWVASAIDGVVSGLPETGPSPKPNGVAQQGSAASSILPTDSTDLYFTDPPYYDSVPYADLSDYFYVWTRRMLGKTFPDLFESPLVPKDEEAIWNPSRFSETHGKYKDESFYEQQMKRAFENARRMIRPGGVGAVVFAHKSTRGWEAILQALIDAGWIATGSWPIDTEKSQRMNAQGAAALASSIHIICRPRIADHEESVGDWRDVLAELPKRIHEWMPRLQSEGVVGADAIFACLGPALEIFSRYSRVEKPNGDQVTLKEYLEYVWAAVSKEAISMIFEGADTTGFEEDARLTAMWLWTLNPGPSNGESVEPSETEDGEDDSGEKPAKSGKPSGFTLEYDAARKIAQGLGAHLEQLVNLVEVKGETARLLPVAERMKTLFGKEGTESPAAKRKKSAQLTLPGLLEELEGEEGGWTLQNAAKPGGTTLDRLHQAMILFAAGRGEALRRFLVDEGAGKDQRFWRLAQSLCALYPAGTDERRWAEGVLARKKGLGL